MCIRKFSILIITPLCSLATDYINIKSLESKNAKQHYQDSNDSTSITESTRELQDSINHKNTNEINPAPTSLDWIYNLKQNLIFHGGLELYNKLAFSTKYTQQNPLPSVSYGYALGELSGGYRYKNFEFMLGAVGAALIFDSTSQMQNLGWNYVGANHGWNVLNSEAASADNTSRVFIHNAYVKYDGENLNVIVGRFLKQDEWFNAFGEGVDVGVSFNENYKAGFLAVSTIGLVGFGWLNNFTNAYSVYGILNAKLGYESENLNAQAFTYLGVKEYVAPGFSVEYSLGGFSKDVYEQDSKNGQDPKYSKDSIAPSQNIESITYATKLSILLPYHFTSIDSINMFAFSSFKAKTQGLTASILLRQDINFFRRYKISLGVYKNFNNANARMGLFGNPLSSLGVDVWDSSAFTLGTSLNATLTPDALNLLVSTQTRFSNLARYIKALVLGLDSRITTAPSANEYSLKLSAKWSVIENVDIDFILNYYTMDMKTPAQWAENASFNLPRYWLDRSYFLARVGYGF